MVLIRMVIRRLPLEELRSLEMKTYLEAREVKSLENAASNVRDKLLIRLLFQLGCRVSEALTLKVEDVDFAHGTVSIQHPAP